MIAELLLEYDDLLEPGGVPGPVLDLACGHGENGVHVAKKNLRVICCDRSPGALESAKRLAEGHGVAVGLWEVDLERGGTNPLPKNCFGAILVFRYLHRPLIPYIKLALKENGLLFYETFTNEQVRFGKPHNPLFLLKPGELLNWFKDWRLVHYFEGIKQNPERAVAQLVCRKPVTGSST